MQPHIYCSIFAFNDSQNERERRLNLTYPPFKLNGFRKTGPRVKLIDFRID